MNTRTLTVAALFMTSFALAGEQEFNLAYKPVKGEITNYELSFEITGLGQKFVYQSSLKNSVVDVLEDGSYLIASNQSDHKVFVDDKEETSPANDLTVVTTYDSLGKPTAIGGDQSGPETFRVANLTSFFYPTESVKLGGKWTVKVLADAKNKTRPITHNYQFLYTEMVKGRNTGVIDVSAREEALSYPASTKGKVWIDLETGETVRYEVAIVNMPVGNIQASGLVTIVKK